MKILSPSGFKALSPAYLAGTVQPANDQLLHCDYRNCCTTVSFVEGHPPGRVRQFSSFAVCGTPTGPHDSGCRDYSVTCSIMISMSPSLHRSNRFEQKTKTKKTRTLTAAEL